ncbi:MAG: DoxX family protein [Muribaculaceae bacterium]|nr:DoxX family protein [Muribaculaceae bacterium]
MRANNLLKKLFFYSAGHTYSNLSRLFLRLFTGVMFLQLCIRQMLHFDEIVPTFQGFLGLSPEGSMSMLLVVELLCATFIILGLLTRLAVLPPMIIMCIAEELLLSSSTSGAVTLFSFQPGYPVMFLGVFCFILLAGPGKISLDYIIGVHLIENKEDNETLEKA